MDWVMLERFVFRRDDGARPFPVDETTAIRVSLRPSPASTSSGLAGPSLVAAHRDCVIFRLTSVVRTKTHPPYLVYPDAAAAADPSSSPSLTRLPTCLKPEPDACEEPEQEEKVDMKSEWESELSSESGDQGDGVGGEGAAGAGREGAGLGVEVEEDAVRSSSVIENIGLLCRARGEDDEFVVAELQLDKRNDKVSAVLSLLRSGSGEWDHTPLPVHYKKSESTAIRCFSRQDVVPFGDCLCWVDYRRGIILGDILEQSPKLSFLPFPHVVPSGREDMHRGVCATNGGRPLKVHRCCHQQATPQQLHHHLLQFAPDGRRSREVGQGQCQDSRGTVTLVTIDMDARAVVSVLPYIKGAQDLPGEDADLAEAKSHLLQPFLPAMFSRPLNLTREHLPESCS